jgi:DNA-binding transcriptional ArsR family regulator
MINGSLDEATAELVAYRLAALGEPTRLKLVGELRLRESATVQELTAAIGGALPNVSKHLQILHQAGIVARRKQGTFVRYRMADDAVSALVGYALRIFGAGANGR